MDVSSAKSIAQALARERPGGALVPTGQCLAIAGNLTPRDRIG